MLRTITVRELREALEGHDDDARVIISADYGDRAHTEQALALCGDVDEVQIVKSAYSSSGYRVLTHDEDDDYTVDDNDGETFLRLS